MEENTGEYFGALPSVVDLFFLRLLSTVMNLVILNFVPLIQM